VTAAFDSKEQKTASMPKVIVMNLVKPRGFIGPPFLRPYPVLSTETYSRDYGKRNKIRRSLLGPADGPAEERSNIASPPVLIFTPAININNWKNGDS
jgi:hypothetical protein